MTSMIKLWTESNQKYCFLAVHYAWAIYVLVFNSMVLNISAYGEKHIHMNTVVMGKLCKTFQGL